MQCGPSFTTSRRALVRIVAHIAKVSSTQKRARRHLIRKYRQYHRPIDPARFFRRNAFGRARKNQSRKTIFQIKTAGNDPGSTSPSMRCAISRLLTM